MRSRTTSIVSVESQEPRENGTGHFLGCYGKGEGVVPRLCEQRQRLLQHVTEGERRLHHLVQRERGGNYKGHVDALAPTVLELANLEREAQSSFLHLQYMPNQLFRAF